MKPSIEQRKIDLNNKMDNTYITILPLIVVCGIILYMVLSLTK